MDQTLIKQWEEQLPKLDRRRAGDVSRAILRRGDAEIKRLEDWIGQEWYMSDYMSATAMRDEIEQLKGVVGKLKAGIISADDEYWDRCKRHADEHTAVLTKRAVEVMTAAGFSCPEANEPDVVEAIVTLLRLSLCRSDSRAAPETTKEGGTG